MQEEIAEVLDLVEKAQARGTFSLADAIKNKANPTDTVEVYLDAESAYELTKINDQLVLEMDPENTKPLEEKAAILAQKIKDSRVVFNMRGVDQEVVEKAEASVRAKYADDETDDWWREYICALVALNIVSVENANGDIDDHIFTTEEVVGIRNTIPTESWNKIISTMQKLTLATGYFKGLTDAGFLPMS